MYCYSQRIPEKDYLVHLVFAIVKLSAISLTNQEALRIVTELYRDCFEYAQKTNQVKYRHKKFTITHTLGQQKTSLPIKIIIIFRLINLLLFLPHSILSGGSSKQLFPDSIGFAEK